MTKEGLELVTDTLDLWKNENNKTEEILKEKYKRCIHVKPGELTFLLFFEGVAYPLLYFKRGKFNGYTFGQLGIEKYSDILITVGYEGIENCKNNHSKEIDSKYNKKAIEIVYNSKLKGYEKHDKLKELQKEYFAEIFNV